MNNISIKVLAFLALSFLAHPVHAAIEPPFTEVQYCAKITNISKYPNFVVISRPTLEVFADEQSGGYQQIADNTCFTRRTRERIFAIKKDDFKEPLDAPWKEQDAYFKSLGLKLLDSQVEISVAPLKSYEKGETRKSITDEYSILTLDTSHFTLSLDKRITTYTNGHTQELQNPTADPMPGGYEIAPTPEPKSESFFASLWAWFVELVRGFIRIIR